MAATKRMPWSLAGPYVVAQCVGATIGGLAIWGVFAHKVDAAGVGQLGQLPRLERRHEQPLDQTLRRLASGAMGHVDLLVAELGALGPRGLDDPEDLLLAIGDGGHQTTSRSRAKRPKL